MRATLLPSGLLAVLFAAALVAAPAHAKPHGEGHGKDKHEHEDKAKDGHGHRDVVQGAYFDDRHRTVVRTYYAEPRHCPPGLAKKHNGCMPPGQAKKWRVGERLPTTVVYTAVPQPVLVQLPPVPTGYRYVNVTGDILLVALGSMMVVDGINGLMR